MNEVARVPAAGGLTTKAPELSPTLLQALYLIDRYSDPVLLRQFIDVSVCLEAERVLASMASEIDKAPRTWIDAWLGRVNTAMSYVLPTDELDLRSEALIEVLRDLPRAAFTAETLRRACLAFRNFPGAKDVHDLLSGIVAPLLERKRQLQRIATCRPSPGAEVVKPLDQAERDEILAGFRAKLRPVLEPERTAAEQIAALGADPPAKAACLTPDQLRALRSGGRTGDVVPDAS